MATREINGSRAIVTGASSGIGQALAEQLVRLGARVVVVARRQERLDALGAMLVGAAGQVRVVAGDITDDAVRRAAIGCAQREFGGLDLLVNNAGSGAMGNFAQASPERLRHVMEVNFFAPAELIRLAVPVLRDGVNPLVVNISSILGKRGIPFCAEYCASKFALQGLGESLRAELAPLGMDLLTVNPGTTETEFFAAAIDAKPSPWGREPGASPAAVAQKTIAAIRRGKHEIVVGSSGRMLVWLNRFAPRLADRLMARYG